MLTLNITLTLNLILILTLPRPKNPIITLTLTLCCLRYHHRSKCRITIRSGGPSELFKTLAIDGALPQVNTGGECHLPKNLGLLVGSRKKFLMQGSESIWHFANKIYEGNG